MQDQPEQSLDRGAPRGGHAAGWTVHGLSIQTNLPSNEFTALIVYGLGSRRGAQKRGVPLAPRAAYPQPPIEVTPEIHQQLIAAWKHLMGPSRLNL